MTGSRHSPPDPPDRKRSGNRALLCFGLWLSAAACGSEPPVTLRAGLLLDGRGGQTRDALITVAEGRIQRITGWQGEPVTHDLSRFTVLPGLIDSHVHLAGYLTSKGRVHTSGDGETAAQSFAGRAANARVTLLAGFTTVVSMGSDADKELRERIEDGSIQGPRILTSLHPILQANWTPAQLRREVRRKKTRGADIIKVFGSRDLNTGGVLRFNDRQLGALCDEARGAGLRAVIHADSDASIKQLVEAGCDIVEHGSYATASGLRRLAEKGIWLDPQCALVFDNYTQNQALFGGLQRFDSVTFATLERLRRDAPRFLRAAMGTPGLKLLYGSDAVALAHGKNAEDLVCRVREAGQDPMDALVTATSRNAEAFRLGKEIGTLAPGYQADLIALEGNPLEEIEAVRRVRFVMKGGKIER